MLLLGNKRSSIVLCLFLFLMAGILFTWPLTPHFFSNIPYALKPIEGFEQVPLVPGDHLQTYYWFWLLSDNFFGKSALFTNPYEFNGPMGPMSAVYANFPFSLLYVLLLPLGPIGAYNGLILLSFLFCGLAMFLLTWHWTRDFWASLLAGLVFAVFPYRVSHIAGGQLSGYIVFLLPLCLYFVELTLERGRWIYGGAAGLCIVLMSLMEPHISFITAMTLGIYLPCRILLVRAFPLTPAQEKKSPGMGLAGVLAGGWSLSLFLWMGLGKKAGLPFWHLHMIQPLILGTLTALFGWFFLSAFLARTTILSFVEARSLIGKGFFFFVLLLFYALKFLLPIPHLGQALASISFGLFLAFLIILGIKKRDRFPLFDRIPIIKVLLGVGIGLAIASAYLIHIKTTVFLPSLAGKGRGLSEVLLFSPKVSNFFFWQDLNFERFVFLGWGLVILATLGLVPLFRGHPNQTGKRALAGLIGFLALVLTLGPTLNYFPLYQFLYHYFPFFNYPRVPARFVMVGVIFLCLLAAMGLAGLRDWLSARGWIGVRRWIPLLIIVAVVAEYHSCQPLGLSIMTGSNRIYQEIQNRLPKGRMVLELPIWPGDSHQSSAYEYTVTRTGKPMINGYAPVVFRDYIREVFWPLYPLDFGEFGAQQKEKLSKLKVDLVTFHDNFQIYSEKVSPFPPRLALKRLRTASGLEALGQDQDITLFKVKDPSQESPKATQSPSWPVTDRKMKRIGIPVADNEGGTVNGSYITSPVQAVYYVTNLRQETGSIHWDPFASGYKLLMEEKSVTKGKLIPRPGARGNIVSALPGRDRPGYLAGGGHRFFPAGKYRARFRLKAVTKVSQLDLGRIEIVEGKTKTLAQKALRGGDFIPSGNWADIPLEFEISRSREIGFRVFFNGQAPLSLNVVIVSFSDQDTGPGSVEAEDLLRQTGTVNPDPLASGKEAVLGKAGFHPPIYLCYGPYRTFEPGSYRACFYLRLKDLPVLPDDSEVVLLEVATDMGKRVFSSRKVFIPELRADRYQAIEVDFNVPFRCELGFRVKYLGGADLLVDRIAVDQRTR